MPAAPVATGTNPAVAAAAAAALSAPQTGPATWLQCEIVSCAKWRKIPTWVPLPRLNDLKKGCFYCYMNPDLAHVTCDVPEEAADPQHVTF